MIPKSCKTWHIKILGEEMIILLKFHFYGKYFFSKRLQSVETCRKILFSIKPILKVKFTVKITGKLREDVALWVCCLVGVNVVSKCLLHVSKLLKRNRGLVELHEKLIFEKSEKINRINFKKVLCIHCKNFIKNAALF